MMLTLLPKDPKCLYAFWDKLPEDKKSLSEGMERLPAVYLRISNLTDGSTLMVRVNDFSDSWYINVPSAGCSYLAEIGRKLPGGEFVAIAASNVTSTAGNCLGSTENIAF
ncbi:MAG: DUF4912 domain-containing protein, partial [Clostridiales bacterium]|nr:DUF4912 domain-containing protein [Clostridiales bacterium]